MANKTRKSFSNIVLISLILYIGDYIIEASVVCNAFRPPVITRMRTYQLQNVWWLYYFENRIPLKPALGVRGGGGGVGLGGAGERRIQPHKIQCCI